MSTSLPSPPLRTKCRLTPSFPPSVTLRCYVVKCYVALLANKLVISKARSLTVAVWALCIGVWMCESRVSSNQNKGLKLTLKCSNI